jgi:hypothetical protein
MGTTLWRPPRPHRGWQRRFSGGGWGGRLQDWRVLVLRRVWRVGRLFAISASIFSMGKLVGAMEFAWDPKGTMRGLVKMSINADPDARPEALPPDSKEARRVRSLPPS